MNCIITQSKDQSNRLKDWILYHKEEGFDTIIYFDDYSEDNSVEVMKSISNEYGIDIIVNYSDSIGNKKSRQEMTNSDSYGGDTSVHNRLIRSYNSGLKISRELNSESICAIIDVDEFLVSNSGKKITDVIRDTMNDRNVKHLYINSFDISDDFDINSDWYSTNENTKFRWDYKDRKNTIYGGRGKSVCVASEIIEIPQLPNYIHTLTSLHPQYFEKVNVEDYDLLRMHHYRKPCMDKSIKFVEDRTLLDKMIKIREKYEI
jgi:hypothetical protein